jgi:hypothetical protein
MKRYRNTEYFVDQDGNIFRFFIKKKEFKKKSYYLANNGYLVCNLSVNGKNTTQLVHRIIAETLIPNPENKSQVNHINGKKLDNSVSNLEWLTCSENNFHKVEVLKKGYGEKVPSSKLTESQIQIIRDLYSEDNKTYNQSFLSKRFNVSRGCIWRVVNNQTWNHL